MATPKGGVSLAVKFDQRAFDKAQKRIDQYQGRPLATRARKAYIEGTRLMVSPMRKAAPRGATGKLRSSIAARSNRLRAGEMAAATVGVRRRIAPHGHLVEGGTKPHSLAAKRAGKSPLSYIPEGRGVVIGPRMGHWVTNKNMESPGSRANPFVERVTRQMEGRVVSFINQNVLELGSSFRVSG